MTLDSTLEMPDGWRWGLGRRPEEVVSRACFPVGKAPGFSHGCLFPLLQVCTAQKGLNWVLLGRALLEGPPGSVGCWISPKREPRGHLRWHCLEYGDKLLQVSDPWKERGSKPPPAKRFSVRHLLGPGSTNTSWCQFYSNKSFPTLSRWPTPHCICGGPISSQVWEIGRWWGGRDGDLQAGKAEVTTHCHLPLRLHRRSSTWSGKEGA